MAVFHLMVGWSLAPKPLFAQEKVAFDFDDPPETKHPITDSLSYGVELEMEGIFTDNRDLDSSINDDQAVFEPKLDAAFTFEPDERFRAY
ncbi:MAG: hypothetical protein R3245_07980, partial [Kiloniellales bacterium]|nr:hypothetical protein [Kiloniellales bacterium]